MYFLPLPPKKNPSQRPVLHLTQPRAIGTLISKQNVDVQDIKMETGSGCFLSLGALTQQIRTLEGKRKNSDSLCETEAFHPGVPSSDGQRSRCLSSLLCLTRKHNVSQAKDKERLIRLTFQGCFLVSLIISLAFYLYHDYIFFFSYSIHCLYFRSYSGSYSIFPLFFVYNLNRN